MAEYATPPPEHDHVEAWLATIHEVNPTSPYELAQLRAEMSTPGVRWTDAHEARLVDLGVAQTAVQSLVAEYIPVTERYGRNTKADPSPFEYEDRVQAACEGLTRAAWQYRVGMKGAGGVPMTFLDYAKLQVGSNVLEWKRRSEGRFFEMSGAVTSRVESEARRPYNPETDPTGVMETRRRDVERFVEVRKTGLALEELEPEDLVTQGDPTFEAGATADLQRIYRAVSTHWSPEQKRVMAAYLGLLGDQPVRLHKDISIVADVSVDEARMYIKRALSDFRRYNNAERFAGYVPDEAITFAKKEPQVRESEHRSPSSTAILALTARRREQSIQNAEVFEQTLTSLKQALAKPGYFAQKHTEKQDVYEATKTILQSCPGLKPQHVEAMWNRGVEPLVNHMHRILGQNFELWRVGMLFSTLLSAIMDNTSIVQLQIPPSLAGKIDFVGAGLMQGTLFVKGDVGQCAAANTGPDATVRIEGRAGMRLGIGGAGIVTALYSPEQGRQRF